jgi:hypothetical protein
MVPMNGALGRPEHDPAFLAFIKCHLTSLARWNILRLLSEDPGYPWSVDELARQAYSSGAASGRLLDELVAEGLVERCDGSDGPTYILDGAEPTSRVLTRLLIEAGRDQGLRRIIVARMLAGEGLAASRPHGGTPN